MLVRSALNRDFSGRVAFAHLSEPLISATGDRTAFLGRNGSMASPAALRSRQAARPFRRRPRSVHGAACVCEPRAWQTREVVFTIGQGADLAEARNLVRLFGNRDAAADSLPTSGGSGARSSTRCRSGRRTIRFDVMINQWLLYRRWHAALWARSGYYQPGGAFGFRDQLQDVMALAYTPAGSVPGSDSQSGEPAIRRGRCAALVARAGGTRSQGRAAPTISCGCPTSVAPLHRDNGG